MKISNFQAYFDGDSGSRRCERRTRRGAAATQTTRLLRSARAAHRAAARRVHHRRLVERARRISVVFANFVQFYRFAFENE